MAKQTAGDRRELTPFELVKTILSYPRCVVLINFMYEEVNRYLRHLYVEQLRVDAKASDQGTTL